MLSSDCDDQDPQLPGAVDAMTALTQIVRDSDWDCDQDGQDSDQNGGTDCDDSDPAVFFGIDIWYDGIDSNCDGASITIKWRWI